MQLEERQHPVLKLLPKNEKKKSVKYNYTEIIYRNLTVEVLSSDNY